MTEKAAPSQPMMLRLLRIAVTCVALVVAIAGGVHAQVPGANVNMVSGTRLPDGDPFLQRQNEPSIAVSTRNPCHLLAGANDYRTVELPGLPDDGATGDAWLGLFKSFDCGRTWKSTLIPGFPQDVSAEGLASPLKGLAAGADPIVRAGTNGLFYYSGIAFNRGQREASKAFVARFIDNNVDYDETGARVDPIAYIDTAIIDRGTSGQFIDKPAIAVDIPRNGKTCSVAGQTLPAGTVYAVYSTFIGKTANNTTRLMLSQSADCGATWSAPSKISEGVHTNQGAMVAVAPNGNVYVAWRQFAYEDQPHAIVVVRSADFGKTFSKPVRVAAIAPFDQNTSLTSFRTNAYPTMAIDGNNQVYVAWSARGFVAGHLDPATGDARIVMSTSSDGGATWSQPRPVDNPTAVGEERGHQIMPALTFAAGRLQLIYYDLRDDQTYLDYLDEDGAYSGEGRRTAIGDRKTNANSVFGPGVSDWQMSRRHNVDVRGLQWRQDGSGPSGRAQRISQYPFGITLDPETNKPSVRQVAFNPPNLPLYAQGTAAFLGDYIDVAALAFVPTKDGGWAFNTASDGPPVFHAVWTDNRDVRPPRGNKTWADYTPPGSANCDPANPTTGLRNANIYTSAIAPPLVVTSPANAKGLSNAAPVAFPIVVDNRTAAPKWYRLQVSAPRDVNASFVEATIRDSQPPVDVLFVQVASMSGVARTVFAQLSEGSSQKDARLSVAVDEVAGPDGPPSGGDTALLELNADKTNPAIMNPAIMNPAIMNQVFNPDIMNPTIMNPDIMNPAIMNPDVMNPAIMNPAIMNPDVMNPAIMNPDIMNPTIMNPDVMNPAIMNPTIANPDVMNPAIMNWDLTNAVLTDVTWTIKNRGNTAASYSLKLTLGRELPIDFKSQLIVHKKYVTPAVGATCAITSQTQEQVIANILNPPLQSTVKTAFRRSMATTGSETPDPGDVTIALGPGEEAKVTLRIADPNRNDNEVKIIDGREVSVDVENFNPVTDPTPQVEAQAVNVTEVNGEPVLDPTPPIVVGSSYVTFVQQPAVVTAGLTFPLPVRVKVTDPSGAVVPNVTIRLLLAQNPGNATLANAEATTDVLGIATFTGLTVSTPGVGYQLEATAASVYTTLSTLFDVASPSVGGQTLRQLASDTSPEFAGLPTTVGTPIDAPNGAGDYFFQADGSALFYRPAGPHQATRVLQQGDPTPGFTGGITDIISNVKINASGNGSFIVFFYQANAMKTAILGYDGQRFHTVVYSDDVAPNSGGARFERGMSLWGFNDPGDTLFSAPLVPPRTTPVRTTFFLAPASGPIVRLVGLGDMAPGGGTFSAITAVAFNNAGDLLFRGTLAGGPGGSGLFVASRTGILRKIVANGDPDPATPSGTFALPSSAPVGRLNGSGQVAFAFNNVVYLSSPGAALQVFVPAGTAVPPPVQGTLTTVYPSEIAFNDRGDLALQGNVALSGGGSRSVMVEIPSATGSVEIITYDGEPAPGIAGRSVLAFGFGTNVSGGPMAVTFNNVGTAAFSAQLDDASVVLYKRPIGGPSTILARSGQAFSSLGGAVVADPSYFHFYDTGTAYFESFLTGGTAYYGSFLATDSGITVLGSTVDQLPPDARVSLRNLFIGAAGDYVAYNAGRAGGGNAIYAQRIGGVPMKVVADGDPAPGTTSDRLLTQDMSGRVPINANGTVAFEAYVGGRSDRGIYAWTPGAGARKVVATGDLVPGTTAAFSWLSTVTTRNGTSVLNDNGQVVFAGTWPAFPSSKNGLFTAAPGTAPVTIAVTGDPAAGSGTFTSLSSSGRLLNASGQVAFLAYTTSGQGIFTAGGGVPLTKIVTIGDAIAGGTVTALGAPGPLAFDDAGTVIFSATMSGGAASGGFFIASVSGATVTVTPLALDGQPAPRGGNYSLNATSIDVRVNNAGDILFIAPLTGTTARSGLFLRRAGTSTVEAIAVEGDSAPGTTGTFAAMATSVNAIPGESIALGPTAEVMFFGNVNIGADQVPGWFRYRLDKTLEKVLMRGEVLPGCTTAIVVGLSQGAGIGSAGRFSFRVATVGSTYRDTIYTTALESDPLVGCLVARSLPPARVVAPAAPAPRPASGRGASGRR